MTGELLMMRFKVLMFLVPITLFAAQVECRIGGFSTPAFAQEALVNVAGRWVVTMEMPEAGGDATLTLEQEGADLKGMLSSQAGDLEIIGVVEEEEIVFWGSLDMGSGMMIDINFFATLMEETDRPTMNGAMEIITPDGEFAVNFLAVKVE
jgi:hypothetical protein